MALSAQNRHNHPWWRWGPFFAVARQGGKERHVRQTSMTAKMILVTTVENVMMPALTILLVHAHLDGKAGTAQMKSNRVSYQALGVIKTHHVSTLVLVHLHVIAALDFRGLGSYVRCVSQASLKAHHQRQIVQSVLLVNTKASSAAQTVFLALWVQ